LLCDEAASECRTTTAPIIATNRYTASPKQGKLFLKLNKNRRANMRFKLYVAIMLGVIVTGAAWAITKPTAIAEPASTEGFGCCVTGDCCCPGQGDCCGIVNVKVEAKGCCSKAEGKKVDCCSTTAKTTNYEAVAVKVGGCCETGNCCCPLAGLCCDPFARLTATRQ
jgi:hypothetical protein